MLCTCSGDQFKFEEPPQSPESLATRDFSASGLSSRTGDWESKFEDTQVDEVKLQNGFMGAVWSFNMREFT
ncbi:hypothetical protein CJ030_MR0G019215 [Morella rubra]|uniref:Uncharacterized protein n=1 Tax=Morella rubra TaxID=262757 RepID=A0A6A1UHQ2_9ROSI|nr:hypothetical protein CJ030_MR0G019215 [Morella rubra]